MFLKWTGIELMGVQVDVHNIQNSQKMLVIPRNKRRPTELTLERSFTGCCVIGIEYFCPFHNSSGDEYDCHVTGACSMVICLQQSLLLLQARAAERHRRSRQTRTKTHATSAANTGSQCQCRGRVGKKKVMPWRKQVRRQRETRWHCP